MKKILFSGWTIVALVLLGLTLVVVATNFLEATNIDFFYYWGVGRLAIAGENPYDASRLLALQQTYDPRATVMITAWNPPWVLPVFMLFGLFPYPLAHALYLLCGTGLLVACSILIWKAVQALPEKTWLAILFAITFSPVIFSFFEGQINLLVLAGLAGFLYFEKRNPFVAGMSIVLTLVKPHLVYLVFPALLVWVLVGRQWKFVAGAGLTFAFFNGLAYAFNSQVFKLYLTLMNDPQLMDLPTASFYSLYLHRTGEASQLVLVIPLILGFGFLGFRLAKNWSRWSWQKEMSWLIFGSLLTSPFAWFHDEILLLLPLLQVVSVAVLNPRLPGQRIWLWLYLILNAICILLIPVLRFQQYLYYWTPWTFLLIYLMAQNRLKHIQPSAQFQPATGKG